MSLESSTRRTLLLAYTLLVPGILAAGDWPRFRGPGGSGVSSETGLPDHWSETENLVWKTALPGPGSSSPVVSNGKVFVSCYSGYGAGKDNAAEARKPLRHLVCVDPKSGKTLWDRTIESRELEAPFEGIGVPNHGYASSTPAADGERVCAYFGVAGVVAYDFEGKELWRAAVAPSPKTHNFGSGASPIIHKDLVVVPAGIECEAIVAFDKRTGKEAWRAPAEGYGACWGTPIPVETEGRTELVFSLPEELWALNPENGKLRWYARSIQDRSISPSPVLAGGVVYAIGGRQGGSTAVRIGGRGDVTQSHVVWTGSEGSYVPSPIALDGHLYWVTDRGIAYCLKADKGEKVYTERLANAGSIYASVVAGDGKLYVVTRRNGTIVLGAKPKFEEISRNVFASDDSDSNASPAISDGKIYLRSNRFLYCVGKLVSKL